MQNVNNSHFACDSITTGAGGQALADADNGKRSDQPASTPSNLALVLLILNLCLCLWSFGLLLVLRDCFVIFRPRTAASQTDCDAPGVWCGFHPFCGGSSASAHSMNGTVGGSMDDGSGGGGAVTLTCKSPGAVISAIVFADNGQVSAQPIHGAVVMYRPFLTE